MILSQGFLEALEPYSPSSSSSQPTILVVDDEAAITRSVADHLTKMNLQVLLATNATEALSLLQKHQVAVILSDQRMPGITGSEFLEKAYQINPDTVRILMTGYSDIEAVIQAVNQGKIFFYLTKPFQGNEIEMVISKAVEYYCLLCENRHLIHKLKTLNADLERRVQERTLELHQRNEELKKAYIEISKLARLDPLTGLANRRTLDEHFEREWSRSLRRQSPLSLIVADLDHFKTINDTYGHSTGDHVIQSVSSLLRQNARAHDLAARYGGEEFVLLLPDTSLEQAIFLAERMRVLITQLKVDTVSASVTASFGVTTLCPGDDKDSFFNRADRALYLAKEKGRNRVECLASENKSG